MDNFKTETIQFLGKFIFDHPRQVMDLLEKYGQGVRFVTYPEINLKVLYAFQYPGFDKELIALISKEGYHNFIDPVSISLAIAASLTSVAAAVVGAIDAKKAMDLNEALRVMQLEQNSRMANTNLNQELEQAKKELITNTVLNYQQSLNLMNQRDRVQKNALIFFSISAIIGSLLIYFYPK